MPAGKHIPGNIILILTGMLSVCVPVKLVSEQVEPFGFSKKPKSKADKEDLSSGV